MKTAEDWVGNLADFLEGYKYQLDLTQLLDAIGARPFDQELVNEIVLWKVNRYAPLGQEAIESLNALATLQPNEHRRAEAVLNRLLRERGVDLPMASTLLRFRNPKVFQIVDRHAYRAVYGHDYPLYSQSSVRAKIDLYFKYLDDLIALANSRRVDFQMLDRVLYVFDKQINGTLS